MPPGSGLHGGEFVDKGETFGLGPVERNVEPAARPMAALRRQYIPGDEVGVLAPRAADRCGHREHSRRPGPSRDDPARMPQVLVSATRNSASVFAFTSSRVTPSA